MKRGIIIALIASVVLFHGKVFIDKGIQARGELPVYLTAASRLQHREEIYRKSDFKPFSYPPFFALPFISLDGDHGQGESSHGPAGLSTAVVWYLVNLFALGFVIWVVREILVLPRRARMSEVMFWTITLLLAGRNIASVFSNQSHDLLVFAIIALGILLACRSRDTLSGAFFGIAAACKATPLLFLIDPVMRRRPVVLGTIVTALITATLLPDLLFPRPDSQLWIVAWLNTFVATIEVGEPVHTGPWSAASAYNQSLAGTLHRLLNLPAFDVGPSMQKTITLLAYGVVVTMLAWCARLIARLQPGANTMTLRFGQLSTILCGMVLLSPMSSKSHFCVLLYPMAFCAAELLCGRHRWLAIAVAVMFITGTLTSSGIVGDGLGEPLLVLGTVTWTALICLGTVTALLVQNSRPTAQSGLASASSGE